MAQGLLGDVGRRGLQVDVALDDAGFVDGDDEACIWVGVVQRLVGEIFLESGEVSASGAGKACFTETAREWKALLDTVDKVDKHLAMGSNMKRLLRLTENPVKGSGPIYYMAEKRRWTAEDLRKFIRKKLRERFDKDFRNCKFIGESRYVKLDDPNDPDLPQKSQ